MRYLYPVTDINHYDREILKKETAHLNIQEIHIGNGVLVFECATPIDKNALDLIIQAHQPIQYNGVNVTCAEDVDKITGMRIRSLLGGHDPIQEQLRFLTALLRGIVIDMVGATTLTDLKTRLNNTLVTYKKFLDERELIIQEGRDFKIGKGW